MSTGKKFVKAIDLKTMPRQAARDFYKESTYADLDFMVHFIEGFITEMAEMDTNYGGYRSHDEMIIGVFAQKWLDALRKA